MRNLPSLNSLKSFEAAGRHMNFSSAAIELNVTQGAISRQIKFLENYLGVLLFKRSSKNIELTDDGKSLLEKLTNNFDSLELAIQNILGDDKIIKLKVLCPPTFASRWLAARLNNFLKSNNIELTLHEFRDDTVKYDIEIRFGIEPNIKMSSRQLLIERQAVYCSPKIYEKRFENLDFQNTTIIHQYHNKRKLDSWTNWLNQANIKAFITKNEIQLNTTDQAIYATLSGAGLALLDVNMIGDLTKNQQLIKVSDIESVGPYAYWLDIPHEKIGQKKISNFSLWLEKEVQKSISKRVKK